MQTRRQLTRTAILSLTVAAAGAVALLSGCGMMNTSSNAVALTTQLRGANEVPPKAGNGSGQVDAMFDKSTNVLKWKVSYTGLSGPATAGHFHGPAAIGANAGVVLPWKAPIATPMQGEAVLTPAQATDLMNGLWYANIHTAANPGGEVRGQMTVVK